MTPQHLPRCNSRLFGLLIAVLAGTVLLSACSGPAPKTAVRVIVLGVDGMDPGFVERHWDRLPHLDRLRKQGDFRRLGTTIPPQSPVAWSSFITGMDPGGHGVFDFMHRDPATRIPFSSMAEATEASRNLTLGPLILPLSRGQVRNMRLGKAFWQILSEHGIPATVIRMPNNFPPVATSGHTLSGMGTPDLQGTYGTFSYYTSDPAEQRTNVAGGRIERVDSTSSRAIIEVRGPVDTFLKSRPFATVRLVAHLDPDRHAARLDLPDGRLVVLREGEWSEWIRQEFPLMLGAKSACGIFRVFLRQVSPVLGLYVSPVNIDPFDPELPLSTPSSWSRELAGQMGLFHTLGTAEDTSALRAGVLSREEYLVQSRQVMEESLRMFHHTMERFRDGFFFYYFSSLDQNSHILWGQHEDELLPYYEAIDRAVGEAASRAADDATLVVMSDHGFAAFERAVHLNTWLWKEGFITLDASSGEASAEMFPRVDWTRTRVYALGLNSLYLNLKGRELQGCVTVGGESEALIRELEDRLLRFRDPDSGRLIVQSVYRPAEVYRGRNLHYAPDLIVGYASGYRSSWQSSLGGIPDITVEDNTQDWIADHCMAAEAVPGVFLSNRKCRLQDPMLWDLTVTVLREFGIPAPPGMIGRPLY